MSDAAIASIVTGLVTIVTMVVGFLTLWVKLRYSAEKAEEAAVKATVVENKIDRNTVLTMAAGEAAASSAVAAVKTANESRAVAAEMTRTLDKKLNGDLDAKIQTAIQPLREMMDEHAKQDDTNMKELRASLSELCKRIK